MNFYKFYFKENTDGEYSYSSTQLQTTEDIANQVIEFGKQIPEDMIYTDPEDPAYGREDDIHVTVLYGLHNETSVDCENIIKETKPFTIKLGNISFFESDDYRVMKIEIESEELHELYQKLKDNTENTQSFDEYNPHCTIAYVKKDYDDSNLDIEKFKDIELPVNNIVFSSKNKEDIGRINIPLEGDDEKI